MEQRYAGKKNRALSLRQSLGEPLVGRRRAVGRLAEGTYRGRVSVGDYATIFNTTLMEKRRRFPTNTFVVV